MIVAGLEPDPRRRESVRVLIDGRVAWTVPADVVGGLGLRVGERIPTGGCERLDAAADEEAALRTGLRLVERRAHGRQELGRKLARRGHTEAAVDAALGRLERLRLIDDAAFTEQYVIARTARGRGPARLRRDLTALGVDPAVVNAVLGRVLTDPAVDPWRRTVEIAERRAAAIAHLPRLTRQRRLSAFFLRRGFGDERARAEVARLASAD
jgi:regulatory protein